MGEVKTGWESGRSEQVGQIAAALAKAQGAIKNAAKDAKNPHLGNKYADLASGLDACRGPLSANEIAIIQPPWTEGADAAVWTVLIHSSGEWVASCLSLAFAESKGINIAQGLGSVITYLRRYQVFALAGIAPEDDDAEAAAGAQPTNRQGRQQDLRRDAPAAHASANAQVTDPNAVIPESEYRCVWQGCQISEERHIECAEVDAPDLCEDHEKGWEIAQKIARLIFDPTTNADGIAKRGAWVQKAGDCAGILVSEAVKRLERGDPFAEAPPETAGQ